VLAGSATIGQTDRVYATRRTAAWLLVLVAAAAAGAAEPRGPHDATARHSFADVEHWESVFDDPKRDGWQKPDEVVRALALRPGMAVADLGAGTGYFMSRLSRAVAPGGTVFALEPEPNLVVHLRGRAEKEGLDNVVPVLASANDPRLPVAGVDVLLVVDTYHHIDDRPAYFRRARRVLRGAGRVAIVDWQKRETPAGPPPEHRLAREHVVAEMTAAGYRLVNEPDFLPYQYFLVFAPGA
jgi:predicted methyltransferase